MYDYFNDKLHIFSKIYIEKAKKLTFSVIKGSKILEQIKRM